MKSLWHYTHAGTTHGPFTVDELKEQASRQLLLPNDILWQEAGSPEYGIPAHLVIDFPAVPAASSSLPDWLADVGVEERQDPFERVPPSNEVPEWLEDLRLWISLETPSEASSTSANAAEILMAPPTPTGGLPDWLASWKAVEGPTGPTTPVKPPIAPAPIVPMATPVTPTLAPKPSVPPRAKSATEMMRDVTGFDADTGQILDAKKFQAWKQQQARTSAANQPAVSNSSFLGIFRDARTAIETWVDDDKNRLRVLHADLAEIKNNPEVRAIVQGCANYGKEMQEKLLRHLEFVVENRRKYYAALAARLG
jgi:hypothetical protein